MKTWFGVLLATGVAISLPANAAGVAPGTQINNTATVDYTVSGVSYSNTTTLNTVTVDELIDVTVTWQNGAPVQVQPGATDQSLLFRVTNTGNGTEAFTLAVAANLSNDQFDPANARIYFDSDASGDFSVGDVLYAPGSNDPVLASGASVDVLIVSDIPGSVVDGNRAFARLKAASNTFTGNPGQLRHGAGDGGVDAVLGHSGGKAADKGEYMVANSPFLIMQRSAKVTDPKGGDLPVSGATILYTIKVTPTGISSANSALVTDAIPANTTYVPGSLTLNGTALGDGTGDGDPGDFNVTTPGSITVDLGALAATASAQLITFKVKIN